MSIKDNAKNQHNSFSIEIREEMKNVQTCGSQPKAMSDNINVVREECY